MDSASYAVQDDGIKKYVMSVVDVNDVPIFLQPIVVYYMHIFQLSYHIAPDGLWRIG